MRANAGGCGSGFSPVKGSDAMSAGPSRMGFFFPHASSSKSWASKPARHVHNQLPGSGTSVTGGVGGMRTRLGASTFGGGGRF